MLVVAVMLASGCGTAGPTTMGAPALLTRVHAAYLHVPAVQTVDKTHAPGFHATEDLAGVYFLRHGVTMAEEVILFPGPHQAILFASRNGPTYGFSSSTNCWKPTPNYRRSLTNLGLRFPDAIFAKMHDKTARRAGSFWLLRMVEHGSTSTLRIDAKTLLVQGVTTSGQGVTETGHYRTLARAPTLPTLRPLCPR